MTVFNHHGLNVNRMVFDISHLWCCFDLYKMKKLSVSITAATIFTDFCIFLKITKNFVNVRYVGFIFHFTILIVSSVVVLRINVTTRRIRDMARRREFKNLYNQTLCGRKFELLAWFFLLIII